MCLNVASLGSSKTAFATKKCPEEKLKRQKWERKKWESNLFAFCVSASFLLTTGKILRPWFSMRPQLVARSTVNFFLSSSLIDSIGSPSHSTGFVVVFPFIVVLFLDINSCWRVCSVVLLPHLLHSMLFPSCAPFGLSFIDHWSPGIILCFFLLIVQILSLRTKVIYLTLFYGHFFSLISLSLSLIYFRFSFSLSPSLTLSHSLSLTLTLTLSLTRTHLVCQAHSHANFSLYFLTYSSSNALNFYF